MRNSSWEVRRVEGWRSRLSREVAEAEAEARSLGFDSQPKREPGHAIAFLQLHEVLMEGLYRPPQAEPARSRGVSPEARKKAAEALKAAKEKLAERVGACQPAAVAVERDLEELKRELLAIRREDWKDRKENDPEWYARELAYNAARRRQKPPPSALPTPERREKDRARYAERKKDPAFMEYERQRQREWRAKKKAQAQAQAGSGVEPQQRKP